MAKDRTFVRYVRRHAVLGSGIDTTSKITELFLKTYEGENTPEAMRAAAEEYGIPLVPEQ